MVIFSGTVLFLLWLRFVNDPEFHGLMEMDKSYWPRCLLWHGWLPLLSGVNGGSPWAENPAEGAGNLLECALGSCTSGLLAEWQLPVVFGAEGAAGRVAAEPDVWSEGSLVQDKVSGASSSGSGFSHHPGQLWAHRRWGHLDDDDIGGDRILFLVLCRLFRDKSSGVLFLLFRLLIAFTLELVI